MPLPSLSRLNASAALVGIVTTHPATRGAFAPGTKPVPSSGQTKGPRAFGRRPSPLALLGTRVAVSARLRSAARGRTARARGKGSARGASGLQHARPGRTGGGAARAPLTCATQATRPGQGRAERGRAGGGQRSNKAPARMRPGRGLARERASAGTSPLAHHPRQGACEGLRDRREGAVRLGQLARRPLAQRHASRGQRVNGAAVEIQRLPSRVECLEHVGHHVIAFGVFRQRVNQHLRPVLSRCALRGLRGR